MPQALVAGLPPNLNLTAGYVVRFAALDPTDGSTISGVNIVNAALYVNSLAPGALDLLASGQFTLVSGSGG